MTTDTRDKANMEEHADRRAAARDFLWWMESIALEDGMSGFNLSSTKLTVLQLTHKFVYWMHYPPTEPVKWTRRQVLAILEVAKE